MTMFLVRKPSRAFATRPRTAAPAPAAHRTTASGVAFNVAEDANSYLLEAALPGIDPQDLEINLENQVLTVQGERKTPELPEDARYHLREQAAGRFERSFRFRQPLDATALHASYQHGMLTIRLPKAEAAKPRRVEVQVAQPTPATEQNEAATA